jgi:hypothetical protein
LPASTKIGSIPDEPTLPEAPMRAMRDTGGFLLVWDCYLDCPPGSHLLESLCINSRRPIAVTPFVIGHDSTPPWTT